MTSLFLIGIGTGNPEHISLEGVRRLNEADLILLPQKGETKSDLADLRVEICDAVLTSPHPPIIPFTMPTRQQDIPYLDAVSLWHQQIAVLWQDAIESQPVRPQKIAMLIWGDPGLYDSALRISEKLTPLPDVTVVPGITSLQALCAAHKIPMNGLASAFQVMTGRLLRESGFPSEVDRAFVMLDGSCSFQGLEPEPFHIYWGAYLGMANQILCSGPVAETAQTIIRMRAEARAQHGWIMDSYLLVRRGASS